MENHNFIRNVFEFSHTKNMPNVFYNQLCSELVRNAIIQAPDNDMQTTILKYRS
jgi:hypothetical protein